jgi:hypothetical protein
VPKYGWEFPAKNNYAEDRIDGTNGYFRRNSGFSAEQKTLGILFQPFRRREKNLISVRGTKIGATLGIPFRTLLRKIKQLKISNLGKKIEANSSNAAPNHSVEEKTTQNKTAAENWYTLADFCHVGNLGVFLYI